MRWPKLVVPFTQSTPVSVVINADGIDEDGAPVEGVSWYGNCNWQDHVAEVFAKEKAETEVHAILYIDGDPFPTMNVIAGGDVTTAYGEERSIVSGMKARNPDGTVNYTRLDLK